VSVYKPGNPDGYPYWAGRLSATLKDVIDFNDATSRRRAAETLREYDAWVKAAAERGAAA
jgi:hypothetical protein